MKKLSRERLEFMFQGELPDRLIFGNKEIKLTKKEHYKKYYRGKNTIIDWDQLKHYK